MFTAIALPVWASLALARLSLQLACIGFGLAALSGTLLFAVGSNAAMFHARQSLDKLDRTARIHMVVSTILWVAIIACGRGIAYV